MAVHRFGAIFHSDILQLVMPTRAAILASGSGTIAQSLLDASRTGVLGPVELVVVASDRRDATALQRASDSGVEAVFVDPSEWEGRAAYSKALAVALLERDVEMVCLAGFMRILSAELIDAFRSRILNTHPSLLPAFPGAHAIRDALAWGAKVTGATIHLVDEKVDHGPIVAQEAVPIIAGDDEDSLHERVKQVERRLFPDAVRALGEGRITVEGRLVTIQPEGEKG